ncbi:MAG: LytTR family transcriptional regulator [Bacteroidetes bacterium]|nr:LytTR family transcriptional regulator [Bacteroidota bacterium]
MTKSLYPELKLTTIVYFCPIVQTSSAFPVLWRNALGLSALLIAYYIPDRPSLAHRQGFDAFSPYLFLVLMYGWIIFHNTFLFSRLYLQGKTKTYLLWTLLLLAFSSINMHLVLMYLFHQANTLPHLLSFWVFTLAGLGVYVLFRYVHLIQPAQPALPKSDENSSPTFLHCSIDGLERQIPLRQIQYLESLENYAKIVTEQKTYIARLSLKDAEAKLPRPAFLRISRSHIVHTAFITRTTSDEVFIQHQSFKIGKVFKRYVVEHLDV